MKRLQATGIFDKTLRGLTPVALQYDVPEGFLDGKACVKIQSVMVRWPGRGTCACHRRGSEPKCVA